MDASSQPAGWHPDPFGRYQYRYWDGSGWTDQVSRDGIQATDPAIPSVPGTAPGFAPPAAPPAMTPVPQYQMPPGAGYQMPPGAQYPAGQPMYPGGPQPFPTKNKATAGILAILLGDFGAHKFYLGNPGLGVLYLVFFWTFIPGIIGLVEGIIYLTMSDQEFAQKYG